MFEPRASSQRHFCFQVGTQLEASNAPGSLQNKIPRENSKSSRFRTCSNWPLWVPVTLLRHVRWRLTLKLRSVLAVAHGFYLYRSSFDHPRVSHDHAIFVGDDVHVVWRYEVRYLLTLGDCPMLSTPVKLKYNASKSNCKLWYGRGVTKQLQSNVQILTSVKGFSLYHMVSEPCSRLWYSLKSSPNLGWWRVIDEDNTPCKHCLWFPCIVSGIMGGFSSSCS